MTENIKIAKEHRRLETNMNIPLGDENLYVRTLRNRNIQYDGYHISPRQSNLQTNHYMMTTDILTQLQCTRNMSIANTFRQECTLTPTPRHDGYIW